MNSRAVELYPLTFFYAKKIKGPIFYFYRSHDEIYYFARNVKNSKSFIILIFNLHFFGKNRNVLRRQRCTAAVEL